MRFEYPFNSDSRPQESFCYKEVVLIFPIVQMGIYINVPSVCIRIKISDSPSKCVYNFKKGIYN